MTRLFVKLFTAAAIVATSLNGAVTMSAATPAVQGLWLPSLRTLSVVPERDALATPVVNIAVPGDVVRVSFDELADEERYLRYSLEHCDARWEAVGLVELVLL